MSRYAIKDVFGAYGKVKYVDYPEGAATTGYVRFDQADDAATALAALAATGVNLRPGASSAAQGACKEVAGARIKEED